MPAFLRDARATSAIPMSTSLSRQPTERGPRAIERRESSFRDFFKKLRLLKADFGFDLGLQQDAVANGES